MNRTRVRFACATISAVLLAGMATAAASASPQREDMPQDVLDAMSHSSTWGHPDQYGEFNGVQRLASGNYKEAMKFFLIGARYADKLSQLSIGLMYLNGQGVQKDPVTAFAWIAIAAERKYPQFIATRDRIWAELDAQQREQAKAVIEKLYPEYGDAAAKRRMTLVLRRNRTQLTGSYLGFGADSVASMTPNQFFQGTAHANGPMPACGASTIDGAAMTGCGNIYAQWRWDPKRYFAVRDGEWTGTVQVGDLEPAAPPQPPAKTPDAQKNYQ